MLAGYQLMSQARQDSLDGDWDGDNSPFADIPLTARPMKQARKDEEEWEGVNSPFASIFLAAALIALWFVVEVAFHEIRIIQILFRLGLVAVLADIVFKHRHLLLSPLLRFELVRLARGRRFLLSRTAYALVLLAALFLTYGARFGKTGYWQVLFPGQTLKLSFEEMAAFANQFFMTLLMAQLLAVGLLLPLSTASALAGEKERRTLEFLLATELSSSEIVLGKLLARLAGMGLLLLTGLPVLALVQLFGGVEPRLLLAGFVVTLATMVSVGGVGIYISALNQTTWSAAFRTYLAILAFGVIALMPPFWKVVHPVIALETMADLLRLQTNLTFFFVLAFYTTVHSVCGGIFCYLTIRRFRALARQQASDTPFSGLSPREQRYLRSRAGPPVGENALLWKEARGEEKDSGMRGGFMLISLLMVPILLLLVLASDSPRDVVRGIFVCWQTFAFLILAMTAAARFSREMEQSTLDGLLALPDRDKVLYTKWLGSLLYLRGPFLAACILGLCMVLVGWLSLVALVLLVIAWFIYAAFLTNLALWLSLLTGSTLRARMWTMLTGFLVIGGMYLLADNVQGLFYRSFAGTLAANIRDNGAFPPVTLWTFSFNRKDLGLAKLRPAPAPMIWGNYDSNELEDEDRAFRGHWDDKEGRAYLRRRQDEAFLSILGALVGLAAYAMLAILFWGLAQQRFQGLIGPRPK